MSSGDSPALRTICKLYWYICKLENALKTRGVWDVCGL